MDSSDLQQRLAEAEATFEALRNQEVDAVVGSKQIMLLRLGEVERKLRESEQRFRVLVESTAQATWDADLNGSVVEESSSWLNYTGQAPGESLGDGWLQAVHPEDRQRVKSRWKEAIAQQATFECEFRLARYDGITAWTHLRAAPLRNIDGEVTKWAAMNIDITRQKEFERSLQFARDQAEAATRSRGEFLANMSHEIRTPMTAILGYADILGEHLHEPDNLQCVDTIRRNGHFLLEVINDILDLSKIDAGQMSIDLEQVPTADLIHDVRSLMQVRAQQKKLPLRVEYQGQVPATIETDPVRVRQILLNLLSNSIKFTDTGYVQLTVRYIASPPRMQFEVVDTGIGIAQQDIESLFEPFTQAESSSTRSAGGTGLGLTICRRLAHALNGDIKVRSKPGKGSAFTVTINAGRHGELVTISSQDNDSSEQSLANEDVRIDAHVLVVDDRHDILFLATRFLSAAGAEIATANNGADAIAEVAAKHQAGNPFDLVVMDMQMPTMDGYEATRQLRDQGFDRPIVALTANAMKGDRDRCLQAGCVDFITKPLDKHTFLQTLARYLGEEV